MSAKITGTIHWYQDLSEYDQLAYKYGKPENFVYGETGYVLRCQKHASCPLNNGHSGQCKNGDIKNRITRGADAGKQFTAAIVMGWHLFRMQEPTFKGCQDGEDIEPIYAIEGDSEDASPTPTMTQGDYDTLETLLQKIIDN